MKKLLLFFLLYSLNAFGLSLESENVIIVETGTNKVLYEKNSDTGKPIASITKLMTAMVVIDAKLPSSELLTITTEDLDRLKNTTSRVPVGTRLTRYKMLHMALMSSENRAASARGRNYPGGKEEFIKAMNAKAKLLGMEDTRFFDTTGLDPRNVSSPCDLVKMVQASSKYRLIKKFTTTSSAKIMVNNRNLQYLNSNSIVRSGNWDINTSKTGFINEAGRCLVMEASIKDKEVIMVFLNGKNKNSPVRDAVRVKDWLANQNQHK